MEKEQEIFDVFAENSQTDVMMSDKEIDDAINSLMNVSDEEIQASIKAAEKEEKKVGRKKIASTIKAEKLISDFLANKSEENWKALQEFFWYGIRQFAEKYMDDKDDAYDMTIETFINAYENIDTYDPNKAQFSTWLWTICRNNCLGFNKRKARMNIVNNDLSDVYDSELEKASYRQNHSEFENAVFSGNKCAQTSFSKITQELYDVSVNEMLNIPGIGGQILHMKLVDNMKIREIAKELSMNESTVKNYLYRGKENLKRILIINHGDLVETYKDMLAAEDGDRSIIQEIDTRDSMHI